eukprot:4934651-Ditylum_brightwellii.AAC.2
MADLPPDASPTICVGNSHKLRGTGYAPQVSLPPPPTPPKSLIEQCNRSPTSMQWAISNITTTNEGKYVAQAIRDGTAIAVSDGSAKDQHSAAAFALEGAKYGKNRVFGTCLTPGSDEEQEAYSRELSGLYAIVAAVTMIFDHYNIQDGAITVACDGIEALKKAMDENTSYSCRS